MRRWLAAIVVLVAGSSSGEALEMVEADGFRLGFESTLSPLRINTMHRWILTLQTLDGTPISGAEILVSGGMPAHDHGLSTAPRVTGELASGQYVLDGMKFHMSGRWEIVFEVTASEAQGMATVELIVPDL